MARDAAVLQSATPLGDLPRLSQDLPAGHALHTLRWQARGQMRPGADGSPQVWLHLDITGELPQVCQRCLGLFMQEVDIQRTFRFAADEEQAAAQDAEAEEDVLVLKPEFNLLELIEDEVLLALPVVPRHPVCPQAPKLQVQDPDFEERATERVHPFAGLAALRKN